MTVNWEEWEEWKARKKRIYEKLQEERRMAKNLLKIQLVLLGTLIISILSVIVFLY